jgi:hypothetical protein
LLIISWLRSIIPINKVPPNLPKSSKQTEKSSNPSQMLMMFLKLRHLKSSMIEKERNFKILKRVLHSLEGEGAGKLRVDLIQDNMIHLQILKNKGPTHKIIMEISKIKMIFINIIQGLGRRMPRIFGRNRGKNRRRTNTTPVIFTKPKLTPIQDKNNNNKKRMPKLICMVTPKPKKNGAEATLKKKKTFIKNTWMATCLT